MGKSQLEVWGAAINTKRRSSGGTLILLLFPVICAFALNSCTSTISDDLSLDEVGQGIGLVDFQTGHLIALQFLAVVEKGNGLVFDAGNQCFCDFGACCTGAVKHHSAFFVLARLGGANR